MTRKYMVSVVAMIAIIAMVIAGCTTPTPPPPPPGPTPRTTGPWIDSILITQEPVSAAAITKLGLNELDIYAFSITDPDLFATVVANPDINFVKSFGSYNEFTFNPVPTFLDGRFNPFGIAKIRESMNKLVDRSYIASEIQGGLAIPKFTTLNAAFADARDRYPDLIAAIVSKYAYNKATAEAEISAEMVAAGAYLDDTLGTWHYDGAELEILVLARVEDERLTMGEYVAAQLEDIGFKCTVLPRTSAEAAPIWLFGDPANGGFHIYTGGWVTTAVSRDQGSNFPFFYTDMGYPVPLWLAYDTDPEFYEVCLALDNNDFTTMDQRKALFAKALPLAMEDSVRIWLTDNEGFSALRRNVGLAADTAGGIYGSWMWGHTVHFKGTDGKPALGGNLRVAMPSMLPQPPNPIAGSNWVYDMFWIRATGDAGYARDVRDGLLWPHNFEKAEITVQTGLPVGLSTALGHGAWCSLSFSPSIAVPGDAWSDWNAATQQFIPASTRFSGGTTALRKSVVYYPKDIFETPLHDGSTLSMGDFIIGAILTFDRGKEASPIYDASAVAPLNSFLSSFKGVKFITDNPDYGLIVETYSDFWTMDAELCISTWWPVYAQGPAVWHTLAVAIRAEADKQLAFSSPKATELGVEWMSFIAGPSLQILRNQLVLAEAASFIPYAPTMGLYVTAEEAAERYANLDAWSAPAPAGKGHFWVATGPYYLQQAFPLTKVIQLERFEDYPMPLGRFDFLVTTP
jgi:peptide/nickel transport system substrate-binding protein